MGWETQPLRMPVHAYREIGPLAHLVTMKCQQNLDLLQIYLYQRRLGTEFFITILWGAQ